MTAEERNEVLRALHQEFPTLALFPKGEENEEKTRHWHAALIDIDYDAAKRAAARFIRGIVKPGTKRDSPALRDFLPECRRIMLEASKRPAETFGDARPVFLDKLPWPVGTVVTDGSHFGLVLADTRIKWAYQIGKDTGKHAMLSIRVEAGASAAKIVPLDPADGDAQKTIWADLRKANQLCDFELGDSMSRLDRRGGEPKRVVG